MKTTLWDSLSSRKRKLIYWVLGLFLFYTIIGFFILPPIIRIVAIKQLSAQLDRQVSIQKIKLNPYVPSLTIRGLLILDKDGQPFVSWDEVYVSFHVLSAFTHTVTFGEISVTKPYARVQMNKDYTFNFSDLIQKFSTNAPNASPKQPSRPLFLRVERFKITGATLSVADYTVRTPFKRVIGPLDLALDDFRTAPDNDSTYSFAGTTDAGENFSWHGSLCLVPLRSQGQLTVNDVTLNKFAPLYQDLVRFEIRSGQIGVHADYRFELTPSNRVAVVSNAAFALRNFKLAQPGDTNDIVQVFHLSVTGASADLQSRQAAVDRIFISGARLSLLRNKDKSINVVELSQPATNSADASGAILLLLRSVTNAVAMLLDTTNQSIGVIHEVDITNCAVHVVDFANSRPAKLDLDDISLVAKNISNLPNTNLTTSLSLRWNNKGTISVETTASISPLAVDVHLALDNLNFSTLDPYLESQCNLLIPGASFGLNGDVRMRTPQGELPEVEFHGDTWLDNLHVVDGIRGEDLVKWDSFRISGIDANLNPPKVSIQQISFKNVAVYVVVETNGMMNLLAAAHPAVVARAQTNAPVIAKNSKSSAAGTNSLAALPQISIASVVVTNTELHFTDRSVTPNVNIAIDHGSGTINGLSSAQLQHADVDLFALVDGVGPVKVTGHINPFSGTSKNQVNVSVKSVDLVPTSPYSGKFAGLRIARGNLYLDMAYNLIGRKLDSKNVITLDQFTFGDKVDSPDATKLPVRLAVDILKDREGKIVLDVPIQGSLDDPKFRIGKVVSRAILNILTKVATSPFSLLGAAFGGGGQELSYQDFVPGTADLTDADKKKLDLLTKALYERPGLQLDISGSVERANDTDGLQRAAFEKELRLRQWMSLRKSKRDMTTPDEMVLTPGQHADWVKILYNEALADGKITPALLEANTNLATIAAQIKGPLSESIRLGILLVQKSSPAQPSPGSAAPPSSLSRLPPLADPEEALLTAMIPISDSDLETLAIDRAKAVRAYLLLGGKVEAGRLFLAQNQGGGLRQDGSRAYLQLN